MTRRILLAVAALAAVSCSVTPAADLPADVAADAAAAKPSGETSANPSPAPSVGASVPSATAAANASAPATPPAAPAPPFAPLPALDADGFWIADELRRIDEGLAVVNASRADMGFQKQPIDDPFRLDVVRRALDDPMSVGREAAAWDAMAREADVKSLLLYASVTLHGTAGARSGVADEFPSVLAAAPAAARDTLDALLRHLHWTKSKLTTAGANDLASDAVARRRLLEKAVRSQVESPQGPKPDDLLEDAAFLDEVKKPSRAAITTHGRMVADAVSDVVAVLRALPADALPRETVTVTDTATFGIPLRVVIGGTGDDVHTAPDADVILDFGGNDTYTHGASANLLEGRAASVVIDLSGDDRYVGGNDVSFGGALGGVAVQWDCGGNDVYVAGNCSLGAGILGVGVLVDEGGDDVFRAKDFCEGAGAFGVGVLLKKGGNDLYHADLFGQGFASTWGCGVLADLGGNDAYDAGQSHLHAPLYRDRYQALSQGFAIGMRPDASGGVGVLVDASGNDRYATDIYGQGSSYWYSLGLLIDDDGNDTYNGVHYCQGTGIHLSAGMLLDRAGNDSYYCLNGVGIGGAHDFAVGFLVDRAGDDYYTGSGGSQGGALTNSVAILLDGGGDDGYSAVRDGTQGFASPARGTGGIGLMLDASGADVFSERTRNEGVWLRDTVGAGIDDPSPPAAASGPQGPSITKEAAAAKVEEGGKIVLNDGSRVWDLDKLWAMSGEWAVNDNSVIVPIARERFCDLGDVAVDRAFERLRSCGVGSGLEFEAVQDVMKRFAATPRKAAVEERLLAKTRDEDHLTRRGAVAVIASLKVEAAAPRLVEMLTTDEKNRRAIVGALAALKKAPPEVAALVRSKSELEGVNAATCLGAAGDPASIATLAASMGPDVAYLPRLAAVEQLAALGEKSVVALSGVARDEKAPVMARRNALRALGKNGHPDALDPIADCLSSGDRWIRLSAYVAAKQFLEKANPVDKAELEGALAAARALERDPLLLRLR